jgi:hypothetical protein
MYEDAVRTSQKTRCAFTRKTDRCCIGKETLFIVRRGQIIKYTVCTKRRFVIFNLSGTFTDFKRVNAFRVEFVHHHSFSV